MTTLVLGGFSLKNKDWAEEVKNKLDSSLEVKVHYWKHWETGNNEDFSIEQEVQNVLTLIAEEHVSIIAKSIGSFVASSLVPLIPQQIDKLILCGIPLHDLTNAEKEEMKNNLQNIPVENLLVFQNADDNHGTYLEAKAFVEEINSEFKIVEKNRNDHEYPYFEDFKKFLI
jgi:predicted alpha/beta hydrolase family esterase